MKTLSPYSLLILCLGLFTVQSVWAHAEFLEAQARAGTTFRAALTLGHGCNGAPIQEVSVKVPESILNVRPMIKPGWVIEMTREPLPKPEHDHGHAKTERVSKITWRGGSLSDDFYDEFVMVMSLPAQAGKMYWSVTQVCEGNQQVKWDELPTALEPHPKRPAAVLNVKALCNECSEH